MNTTTQAIYKRRWPAKLIVALLIAALASAALLTQLGSTLAAPADIVVTLQCETGVSPSLHIEKGIPTELTVFYLSEAASTDTSVATATYTPGINGTARITGIKAGVVSLIYGNIDGKVGSYKLQIVDSDNISGYTVKEGGLVYFTVPVNASLGVTKASPVVNVTGLASRISWSSMNTNIATVSSSGSITSRGEGATIITGVFTDKWGTPRFVNILVGVGVSLDGDVGLGRLLKLIAEGERILAERDDTGQSPYTSASIAALQLAVNQGKAVVNSENPTDSQVNIAINNLVTAIAGMELKLGQDVVQGPDGNYYKKVPGQDNVYEIVNRDGSSKYNPPSYIWGGPDRVPGSNDDKPAYQVDGGFYVEDPYGSNIWKFIDSAGNLQNDPALWGGPDGVPGSDDDAYVKPFGGYYWVDMGQNIWRRVDAPYVLGELTGGGPSRNPSVTPYIRPVYFNAKDGKYYIGPLGPDWTGNVYYYGDSPNGNGLVDSTQSQLYGDDVKYYMDGNGNMVRDEPSVVVSVTVNPSNVALTKGSSYTFTAMALRADGTLSPEGVTWSVNSYQSSISSNGTLVIGTAETLPSLVVTATSVKTPTVKGTAVVTVTSIGPDPNSPQYIVITPQTASVIKGETQAFSATVYRYSGAVDPAGVNWSISSTYGGSSINANGVLTVGAYETAKTLTVTATSKATPSVTSSVTVTVAEYSGSGIPGLKDKRPGETIRIDGIDWIKVKDGYSSGTCTEWTMLLLKDVLYPGNPRTTIYASTWNKTRVYGDSEICSLINNWYYTTNMPTLKKYALTAHYNDTITWCLGGKANSYNATVIIPFKEDIYPALSTSQLNNGRKWWTHTASALFSGYLTGYKVVFTASGRWDDQYFDQGKDIYARPAIYVMR